MQFKITSCLVICRPFFAWVTSNHRSVNWTLHIYFNSSVDSWSHRHKWTSFNLMINFAKRLLEDRGNDVKVSAHNNFLRIKNNNFAVDNAIWKYIKGPIKIFHGSWIYCTRSTLTHSRTLHPFTQSHLHTYTIYTGTQSYYVYLNI